MRRVLLTTAIILAIQPLLRWGFRFAAPIRERAIVAVTSRIVLAIVDASRLSIATSGAMKAWATRWYAKEPDVSPWTTLRCGACRGIGDTHMCEQARVHDEHEEAA